ncbi:MAG TPA: MFS transporter [Acidimicrobiia bacterium]|nr:MFS transporter [Acidimicrobiia bacterium]
MPSGGRAARPSATVPAVDDTIHRRRWWTLAALCLTLAIIGIDNTILNVALPTLVREVHASNSELQWIVDAYTLVFAGLLLTSGSLGDRFGRKGALTTGLVVFGAGSVAAAWSGNATQLIACRALMGIGASLIMPATLSILTNVFHEPRERARAIGVWAGVSGIGIAVGPITGGILLKHFWWGSVFLVNVPVVVTALVAGRFLIPTSCDPNASRLDPVGAVLSIVGLSALLYAIIQGPAQGWTDPGVVAGFAGAAAVLGAFVLWELHSREPMIDVSLFRNPRFTVASLSITAAFFAVNGVLFLLTQLLQFVKGYTPLEAGVRVAPMAAMFMIMGPVSARIVEHVGTKRTVATGLLFGAAGMLVVATNDAASPYLQVFAGIVTISFGMGLVMAPATASIMEALPRARAGVGSAVNDTTRQVGGAMGVAVVGSLFASAYRSSIETRAHDLGIASAVVDRARESAGAALAAARNIGGGVGRAFARVIDDSFVHGMRVGLGASAGICLVGAALAIRFLPARGREHHLNASELVPVDIVVDDAELDAAPQADADMAVEP